MDFNQVLKILMESPITTALARYRAWSDEEIKKEKEAGVHASKRSYVDKRSAFERWVKEKKISKSIATEVEDAMNLKD